MRHLVAGGGGFIGGALVRALLAEGEEVVVIDRSPARPGQGGEAEWVVHDLTSGPYENDLGRFDVVYLLVGAYRGSDSELLGANVSAANHCLASLRQHAGLVIYLGAGSSYGETRVHVTEEHSPAPTTFYGLSKWLGEAVVKYRTRLAGCPWVMLRPTNIYGPGNTKNVVYAFYRAFRDTGAVTIYGDGKQERDFVHVDDFVRLLRLLAAPERRSAVGNQVFNVAGAESRTLLDLVRAVSDAVGGPIPVRHEAAEPGVLTALRMDCGKVQGMTGWKPLVSFSDGVKGTVRSYVL